MSYLPLSSFHFVFLLFLSFFIVAFGQPGDISWLGMIAACTGCALFWRAMLSLQGKWPRFWISAAWFAAVQGVLLLWFLSHPYLYIVLVWAFLSIGAGIQFGVLSLFFDLPKLQHMSRLLAIASCWTLFEWSRLFLLSGSSWNPIGLAFAGNPFSLQLASLGGVFGLSFLVMFTNLLCLRAWIFPQKRCYAGAFVFVAVLPYFFGGLHYAYHSKEMEKVAADASKQFTALLVQTAFPVEESLGFTDRNQFLLHTIGEWKQIVSILRHYRDASVNLIALPELVVPFGVYTFVYPYEEVKAVFEEAFGGGQAIPFPSLELPYFYQKNEGGSAAAFVNNAFWVQTLANLFNAPVVIGLEDAEDKETGREYYSSAQFFNPSFKEEPPLRYAKRVLVPMGEYIPFSFCRSLAAKYGVFASFTCGTEAAVWNIGKTPFGISICYEEMYGNLMRENREKGAEFLLNISNDGWFPNSSLPRRHLEHSRLRTVENGFPLARACNTGITCVVDALGRDRKLLGENDASRESNSDALIVQFPLYHYTTLYSGVGDGLIVLISFGCLGLFFFRKI